MQFLIIEKFNEKPRSDSFALGRWKRRSCGEFPAGNLRLLERDRTLTVKNLNFVRELREFQRIETILNLRERVESILSN
jgi:hypothetical protein